MNRPFQSILLCTFHKSSQNGGFLIPLGTCLFKTLLFFSSNGSIHLIYAYTFQSSSEHLFEVLIFVVNQQKPASLSTISALIFVYLLQINSLPIRLKDVIPITKHNNHLSKNALSPLKNNSRRLRHALHNEPRSR